MQKKNIQINRIRTTHLIPFEEYKKRIFEQTEINPDDENQMKYEKIKKLAELGKSIEQQVQNSLTHLNGFLGLGIKTEDSFEFKRAVTELSRIQKLTADYSKIVVKAHEIAEGNGAEQSQIREGGPGSGRKNGIMKTSSAPQIKSNIKQDVYLKKRGIDQNENPADRRKRLGIKEGGLGSDPSEDDKEELKRSLDKHINRIKTQRNDISNKNFDRRPDSDWKLKGIQEVSKPEPPESLEKRIPPKDYLKKLGAKRVIKKESTEYSTKLINGKWYVVKDNRVIGDSFDSENKAKDVMDKLNFSKYPSKQYPASNINELKDYYGKSIKKGSRISWTDSKGVEHTGIVKDPSGILAKDEKSFQHIDVDPRNDTLKVLDENKDSLWYVIFTGTQNGKNRTLKYGLGSKENAEQFANKLKKEKEFEGWLTNIGDIKIVPFKELMNLKEYGSLLKSKYGFEGDILTEDIKAYSPKDAYLKLSKKNPAYEIKYLLEKNINEKIISLSDREKAYKEYNKYAITQPKLKVLKFPEWYKKWIRSGKPIKEDLPTPRQGDIGSNFPLDPDKNELNEEKSCPKCGSPTEQGLGGKICSKCGWGEMNEEDLKVGTVVSFYFKKAFRNIFGSIIKSTKDNYIIKSKIGNHIVPKDQVETSKNWQNEASKFTNPVKDAVGNMIWKRDRVLEKMFDPKSQKYVFPKKYSEDELYRVEDILGPEKILVRDLYNNRILPVNPKELIRIGKEHKLGYQ